MQLDSKKYLYDVLQAATKITSFINNCDFHQYEKDEL